MFQGISTSEKFANSRKAGIKEDTVTEDELSEEQLQAKQRREEIFNRAKDRELGNKPQSRDIIAKEATGRGTWDSNASDYEGDYGGSRNWGRRPNHGEDERHDLDPTTWYIVKDGKMFQTTVYPRQVNQAMSQGFSPTREEATANAKQQGVAEGSEEEYGDDYQAMVGRVGQQAKQAQALKSKGKEPQTRWNPVTKKYYVDFSDRDEKKDVAEVAPPGDKAERMVKHIKKSYAKDGKLTDKEREIAYATAWKAHNAGKVEEDCWDGYEQIGMKKKSGKTVPNCVPKGK